MRLRSLGFSFALMLSGWFSCLAQQPTGSATLETLLEKDGVPRVGNAAAATPDKPAAELEQPSVQPQGTLIRPIDGVQHQDLDEAWAEYEDAIMKAAQEIRAAIKEQIDAALDKGRLDEAEKWESASQKFEAAGSLPAENATKAVEKRVTADCDKARVKLFKTYDQVQEALTKERKLDSAKAVREEKKSMSTLSQPLVGRPPVKPVGKRRLNGWLYASGDDVYTIFVNGKLLKTGKIKVVPVQITLGVGDVITVKVTNDRYEHGFMAVLFFPDDRKHITTNSATWQSYTPTNEVQWSDPAGIREAKPSVLGDAKYVAAELAKHGTVDAESIWGSEALKKTFLTLKVTEESFVSIPPTVPASSQRRR